MYLYICVFLIYPTFLGSECNKVIVIVMGKSNDEPLRCRWNHCYFTFIIDITTLFSRHYETYQHFWLINHPKPSVDQFIYNSEKINAQVLTMLACCLTILTP